MSNKKWSIGFLIITMLMLVVFAIPTIILDPFFHYRKPMENFEYELDRDNQRYVNDGIMKNFDYNAIITGTSMTENFKTSEFDALYGVNSIKIPFYGASYKEINDNLASAIEANPEIVCIVRGLDCNRITNQKDTVRSDYAQYPWYLYDDLLYNDVQYVLNKEILFEHTLNGVFFYTRHGKTTPTFDEYSNWAADFVYGKEAVDKTYERPEASDNVAVLSEYTINDINGNITQNVVSLAKQNPDVEFYYFFTPYSIYWWDELKRQGNLGCQVEAFKLATELMLECDNIHLYSFFDEYEMICDLDNYKDTLHYGEHINSKILEWMRNGEHCLTKSNYEEYWNEILAFYDQYDYEQYFGGK